MATWLRKNTYVTTKGQQSVNKAFSGAAELKIVDVISSDRWFTGDLPYERNELDRPRQKATSIRAFPASIETSKTAYVIEAEFDSTQNRLDVAGMPVDEKNGEYFLRQIGIFAKTVENGVESDKFLLMWSDCVRTEDVPDDKLDEIAGGADIVPAYSDGIPRVVLTYAFQLDNFGDFDELKDDNGMVNIKVESSGAGLVSHQQLQSELDRRFTTPVVNGIKLGASSKVVGQEHSGNIAKPVEVISSVANGNTISPSMALFKNYNEDTVYFGRSFKVETSVFVYETCDYTVGALYYVEQESVGNRDIQNVVIQIDDGERAVFNRDSSWKNYFSSTEAGLYSLRATFNLSVGWHKISVYIDEDDVEIPMSDTVLSGVSAISVRKGDLVSSLAATDFAYSVSAPQLCEAPTTLDTSLQSVRFEATLLTGVDEQLKIYFPYIAIVDEYTTKVWVEDVANDIKSMINAINADLLNNFGEFRGYVNNNEALPTDKGWYIIESFTHEPSSYDLPNTFYSSKAFLINIGDSLLEQGSVRFQLILSDNGSIYIRKRGVVSEVSGYRWYYGPWYKVPVIDISKTAMTLNDTDIKYDSSSEGEVITYESDNVLKRSGINIVDLVKKTDLLSNQGKFNGNFKNGASLSDTAYMAGREKTGYWLITSGYMPSDMPTVALIDGTLFTPTHGYLHVENCDSGSNAACKQSIIVTGVEQSCTIVRYMVSADPLQFTEWAVQMDSNNATRTSLNYNVTSLTGNEPKGSMQLVTTTPWEIKDITSAYVTVTETDIRDDTFGDIHTYYVISNGSVTVGSEVISVKDLLDFSNGYYILGREQFSDEGTYSVFAHFNNRGVFEFIGSFENPEGEEGKDWIELIYSISDGNYKYDRVTMS